MKTFLRTVAIVTAIMIWAGAPAAGQSPNPTGSYVLGPGDTLEVSVWGHPDLTRLVTVGPDGAVMMPFAGSISAAGMPVEQLRGLIVKAYAEYIIDPKVTVIIKEFRKIRVSVLGQVTRPGTYELLAGARLLDFIAAAGGLTDAADVSAAQLMMPGHASQVVDVRRALAGDQRKNLPLRGGETVVVPEDLTNYVTVQGQVARPGRYHLKGEVRVLDALAMAGGLTDKAAVAQASLTRATAGSTEPAASAQVALPSPGTKTELLGLDAILLRQEMDGNIVLQPGDIVTVPEDTTSKIYIIGDVRTPGVFPLKTDVTLLQALAMAGGPEQRGFATAKAVYVVRRNGHGPQHEITAGSATTSALPNGGSLISADLAAIMKDPSRDITVQPGDVVVLPQSTRAGWQLVLSILSGFGWLWHL